VVGDDPVVEMIMARRGGATGLGVVTGMTNIETWAQQPELQRPHHVLKDIREILTCGVASE
jgi:ribonucleotide monophosphatase NagD (HAD superfamily)